MENGDRGSPDVCHEKEAGRSPTRPGERGQTGIYLPGPLPDAQILTFLQESWIGAQESAFGLIREVYG